MVNRRVRRLGLAGAFLVLLGVATVGLPTATAQAGNDEREVVTDAEDYPSNGALDIVGVYVNEAARYDFDRRVYLGNWLNVRIQFRDLGEINTVPGGTIFAHVWVTMNGTAQEFWGGAMVPLVSNENEPQFVEGNVPGRLSQDSLIFEIAYASFDLNVGMMATGVFAASSTNPDQPVFHDVAPEEGSGAPAGPNPPAAPEGSGSFVLEGPYPYAVLTPTGPLSKLSALGRLVSFGFIVEGGVGVSGEHVRIYFVVPPEWSLDPSRGDVTPAGPVGEITNLGEGQSLEFRADVTAKAIVAVNSTYTILMEMVSDRGAHQLFTLTITVTEPRFESPDYNFTLLSAPEATAGEPATLEIGLTDASGAPLTEGQGAIDFFKDGRLIETATGPIDANGTFTVTYSFPSDGTWMADAYLASMDPAPHRVFTIEVGSGGALGVPGPGLGALLAAVLGLALALRRRR